jgi:C-terminal processing protease CtpA/Prc
VVTEEALEGLGLTDGGRAVFAFADGTSMELDPVTTFAFPQGSVVQPLLRPREPQPVWLRRQDEQAWLTTLDRGRAVYLGFHQTHSVPQGMLDRLRKLARTKKVRRVVVDARLNGGGDNTTYWPLVDAMRAAGRKAVLLVGRKTFSAAGNFAAVVDAQTRARVLGEPSGGAPNQWGDSAPVDVPSLGLTVHVAVEDVQAVPADRRLAVVPDVPVALTAADFFAGRDPVLARALR